MAGVDRRYKLLKQGLAGDSGFTVGELSTGETLYWDGSQWQNTKVTGTELFVDFHATDQQNVQLRLYNALGGVGIHARVEDGSFRLTQTGADASHEAVWMQGLRNGPVNLYYANDLAFATNANGVAIFANNGNTRTILRSNNDAGTKVWQLWNEGTSGVLLDSHIPGGYTRIRGEDAGGVIRNILWGRPNGPTDLYSEGTHVLRVGHFGGTPGITIFGYGTTYFSRDAPGHNYITHGSAARTWWRTWDGSAYTNYGSFYPDGSMVWGNPTGDNKGFGTINAQAVYDDNTLLTDYVFDAELDGQIDVEAWDEKVPNRRRALEPGEEVEEVRIHKPARRFARRARDDLDPARYAESWRRNRRLPAFDDRPGDKLSLGEYAQRLLETCEVQAIHIEKLRQRLEALEARQQGEITA